MEGLSGCEYRALLANCHATFVRAGGVQLGERCAYDLLTSDPAALGFFTGKRGPELKLLDKYRRAVTGLAELQAELNVIPLKLSVPLPLEVTNAECAAGPALQLVPVLPPSAVVPVAPRSAARPRHLPPPVDDSLRSALVAGWSDLRTHWQAFRPCLRRVLYYLPHFCVLSLVMLGIATVTALVEDARLAADCLVHLFRGPPGYAWTFLKSLGRRLILGSASEASAQQPAPGPSHHPHDITPGDSWVSQWFLVPAAGAFCYWLGGVGAPAVAAVA